MSKTESKPEWVKMKPAEVESLIIKLHKEGHPPAKIGLILRDQHGIPKAKLMGKKISQILKEAKLNFVAESEIINKKVDTLRSHIGKNKKDYSASRSLAKSLWIINKLKN